MKRAIILGLIVISICSCASQQRMVSSEDKLTRCMVIVAGGYDSKYGILVSLKSDLGKAIEEKKVDLESEASLTDWFKGYVFEKTPGDDQKEVHKQYLDFLDKCMSESWGKN